LHTIGKVRDGKKSLFDEDVKRLQGTIDGASSLGLACFPPARSVSR